MKQNGKKGRLGRGLDQLLGPACQLVNLQESDVLNNLIPLENLIPGKYQPRELIENESIEELSVSIQKHGLIQPILVRPTGDKYEIVAGERRYRAALLAGLKEIPAIVRRSNDENAALLALIENIQRKDLSSMETANGFQRLITEFGYTHQQIADMTGCSRSAVSNYVRLVSLCPEVQNMLHMGNVSMGHARALLQLDSTYQISLAKKIVEQGLSVREAEKLVPLFINRKETVNNVDFKKKNIADYHRIEKLLSEKFFSNVKIEEKANEKGRILIQYNSLSDLDRIVKIINTEK